ncbi:alpha-mannosidase [Paenibacillus oceani]|uniref:Alpha-mannosidase n=1 Tax=Paenibacillus oceani TaxID=2772510 RepID=A0A927CH04_9BACL|nr:glycoside hydrolase family 38 C-terminal domain-containing protein [Paenibacillus oceani]MBD2865585.1 alpha-mannosidase [Paenibacillus oceani]
MPYEAFKPDVMRAMLNKIDKHIYVPLAELSVTAWVTKEPVVYAERTSGTRIELITGERWGELWDCAWFYFAGKVPEEGRGRNVVLLIDVNGELGLVDEEGSPVQGLTNVSSSFDLSLGRPGKRVVPVSASSTGSETIGLWGDAGCNDLFGHYRSGTLKEAVIALCREDVRQLYYDAEVLLETAENLPETSARREQIWNALYEVSLFLTDLSGDQVAEARRVLDEQLSKRGGDPVLTVSAIGHAHIDLAWLWPLRETVRKGARTFATALRMMEQYPDYVFGASQPQLYDWIKKSYPGLYEQVKERVREGRWEPQGAMWVESDTNVPGGESLVRQILYGKRFFRQEFGIEVKSLWMPDVFGYTASLPQLLKLSGVSYMMTQKLSWSVYNKHPHHTFRWEGLDGSAVLTHMPPEDTYNSPAAPRSVTKAENAYLDKRVSANCLMLFGIGDGGGGPGEEHLERLAREQNLLGLCPVVQEPSWVFFEKLNQGASHYATWRGELYLEKHQGTLTSQGRNKWYNRKLEKALRELEFASVLAERPGMSPSGAAFPYPSERLESIWKEVLLYQFHDILPGSSIKRVYDESLERYAVMLAEVEHLIAERYEAIAQSVSAQGESLTVFNSLPWEREEWLKADGRWVYACVPPMGYAVVSASALQTADFSPLRASASLGCLENDLLKLSFNPDGTIASIYDKEHARELVQSGACANDLSIYDDKGNAWDFPHDYRQLQNDKPALVETKEISDGPAAGLLHRYRYGRSEWTQKVLVTLGSRRIDFVTRVNWRESEKMLRTSFPVDIRSETASCEIQFGFIRRPTHRNTMWDYAKDEICAHHWIDLSEPDYGVALLNDCKYGHRAEGGTLDLNLLRSSGHPDPEADRAEHEFTYSLYPHRGDHIQAKTYKRGYELNVPLRTAAGAGAAPVVHKRESSGSFLELDHPLVMVEAVKRSEDDDGIIVRLYETSGTQATLNLAAGWPVAQAWAADLLENPLEPIPCRPDGKLILRFRPFEIRTIKLAFLAEAGAD